MSQADCKCDTPESCAAMGCAIRMRAAGHSPSPKPTANVDFVEMTDAFQRINNRTPKEWLQACHRVCRSMHKYRGVPLWSFVSDITSHGSTYSMQICRRFGWDPWSAASKRLPE